MLPKNQESGKIKSSSIYGCIMVLPINEILIKYFELFKINNNNNNLNMNIISIMNFTMKII